MGLDQYMYVASRAGQYSEFYDTAEFDATTSEFVSKTVTKPFEIGYRRKHPNSQWVELKLLLWSCLEHCYLLIEIIDDDERNVLKFIWFV